MFRHLSTRNISCKSMHAFFSNLRRIKFHRNPSITSSAIPLKCKNPVPGPAPPVRHLAEKFCTRNEYFTTSNCVFNFNFLALVVSEIIGGPKLTLRGLRPPDAPRGKLWHTQVLAYTYTSVSETIRKPPLVKAQTALENNKKIKYGEKRFSIWRMELLHPAMWQMALGWHAMEFAQMSAVLEFYIWFRFWPYHHSLHVILHQSAKFYPNRTTLRRKKMLILGVQ